MEFSLFSLLILGSLAIANPDEGRRPNADILNLKSALSFPFEGRNVELGGALLTSRQSSNSACLSGFDACSDGNGCCLSGNECCGTGCCSTGTYCVGNGAGCCDTGEVMCGTTDCYNPSTEECCQGGTIDGGHCKPTLGESCCGDYCCLSGYKCTDVTLGTCKKGSSDTSSSSSSSSGSGSDANGVRMSGALLVGAGLVAIL